MPPPTYPTCTDRDNMGLDFGLEGMGACFPKVKNRWLLQIEGVSGVSNALPPLKAARPQLEFKEQQVSHLVQHIFYPVMGDWKPLQLTLYDTRPNENKVFEWVKQAYDPKPEGGEEWKPVFDPNLHGGDFFKRNAVLCMYDGCGKVTEKWKFENCYPREVNFGDLDMGDMSIVLLEISLRYDRAYLE